MLQRIIGLKLLLQCLEEEETKWILRMMLCFSEIKLILHILYIYLINNLLVRSSLRLLSGRSSLCIVAHRFNRISHSVSSNRQKFRLFLPYTNSRSRARGVRGLAFYLFPSQVRSSDGFFANPLSDGLVLWCATHLQGKWTSLSHVLISTNYTEVAGAGGRLLYLGHTHNYWKA